MKISEIQKLNKEFKYLIIESGYDYEINSEWSYNQNWTDELSHIKGVEIHTSKTFTKGRTIEPTYTYSSVINEDGSLSELLGTKDTIISENECYRVTLDVPNWSEIYKSIDELISLSGDTHHIFLEGFDLQPNGYLRVHLGS